MENYKLLLEEVKVLVDLASKFEDKETKATSKRLRDSINTIKKLATDAKKELIENDKSLTKPKA